MKRKTTIGILSLFCAIGFTGCLNDDPNPADRVELVKMYVSPETGFYQPWGASEPVECMMVKEELELVEPYGMPFGGIRGFVYEKGYEYRLSVERTTLANPPADGSNRTYALKEVLSKVWVEPVD